MLEHPRSWDMAITPHGRNISSLAPHGRNICSLAPHCRHIHAPHDNGINIPSLAPHGKNIPGYAFLLILQHMAGIFVFHHMTGIFLVFHHMTGIFSVFHNMTGIFLVVHHMAALAWIFFATPRPECHMAPVPHGWTPHIKPMAASEGSQSVCRYLWWAQITAMTPTVF